MAVRARDEDPSHRGIRDYPSQSIADIATTTIRVRIVNRGRRRLMVGASMGVTGIIDLYFTRVP